MVRSRLGLKVLGLCALALGLMAFVASAAQAEVNSHWNVNGNAVTGAEEFKLEIKELESNTATLLFTTKAGTKVAILCTAAKFDEGGKLIKEGGVSLGRVLFTGCSVKLNGEPAGACKAHSTGKNVGEILTEKGKGLIVLDEVSAGVKEDYVKIVPDEGRVFARIEMGTECAIGELVKVESKAEGEGLWIKDCATETKTSKEQFLTESATHLIEESLHGLIALGQPAVIDGSAIVGLESGALFSGTPG